MLKMYLFVVCGILISFVLPILLTFVDPGARFKVQMPAWLVVKPYVYTVAASMLLGFLLMAAFGDQIKSWEAALLLGYAWDSSLQKIGTGNTPPSSHGGRMWITRQSCLIDLQEVVNMTKPKKWTIKKTGEFSPRRLPLHTTDSVVYVNEMDKDVTVVFSDKKLHGKKEIKLSSNASSEPQEVFPRAEVFTASLKGGPGDAEGEARVGGGGG